jgi:hypothetical protein
VSISAVKTALATRLAGVNPTPQPAPARIYSNPAEALNIADFPSIVIVGPAAGVSQGFDNLSFSQYVHAYTVEIYVLVGPRTVPLPELYARLEPWPQALLATLAGDIRLSGACNFIGNQKQADRFFEYQPAEIDWAGDNYYGLIVRLPVQENVVAATA